MKTKATKRKRQQDGIGSHLLRAMLFEDVRVEKLDESAAKKFLSAFHDMAAEEYRARLLFGNIETNHAEATELIALADMVKAMRSGKAVRSVVLTEDGGVLSQENASTDELQTGDGYFLKCIAMELCRWIWERDAASFRKLADLIEKKFADLTLCPVIGEGGNNLDADALLRRAFEMRECPKFEYIVLRAFRRLALQGIPTKARLREDVAELWERMGHEVNSIDREFTKALKKLGLSALPSAKPVKKSITRGRK